MVTDPVLVAAVRLEFSRGQRVRELGYGPDADQRLRSEIEAIIGRGLAHRDYLHTPQALLVWHRAADGDLAEVLLSCAEAMTGSTPLWLLTPGIDRPGHVCAVIVTEAAERAGLLIATRVDVLDDWDVTGMCLPARAPR
ncbi:DUF3052 family protein [Nocardia sp. NPDC050697]|uniref:DUF3052 family protein n=1 Tax=Nocardia sp. NPDC050697 TaxID=3155158 RepID=UPI0033DE244E